MFRCNLSETRPGDRSAFIKTVLYVSCLFTCILPFVRNIKNNAIAVTPPRNRCVTYVFLKNIINYKPFRFVVCTRTKRADTT